MAVIGIDLGTTYCAVASKIDEEMEIIPLEGNSTMPSVVGVQTGGNIAIGATAKRNQAKNPQDTVVEVKRQMGNQVKIRLGQQEMTPQEISALILSKIKELAENEIGEEITGAVITCPAYFKEPQRGATQEAGQMAGLNVLRVLNEPTAAAYAYGIGSKDEGKENLFLVYDLGGGTFDVTVVSMIGGNLEVVGTGGDPELGGGNFDDRIVDWMIERLGKKNEGYVATLTDEKRRALRLRLKAYAEKAKIALCGPPETTEYQFQLPSVDKLDGKPVPFREVLTMETFEELISTLVENSMKWIDEAMRIPKEEHNYTEENLTEILLVGGSTRVPLIRKALIERFPNTPIRGDESGINPDQIVAMGAGIIASEIDPDSDEVSDNILVDVTGHTLSVAVFSQEENKEYLHALVPKETPIPTSAIHTFASSGNFQTQAKVRIYQGEGREIDQEKVTMVGEFIINIDPIQEPTPIDIGLDLDDNGILIAHATNKITGQQEKCELNYSYSAKMSAEEVKQKQAQLEAQKNAKVGRTANPLDEKYSATMQATSSPAAGATAQPTAAQAASPAMGAAAGQTPAAPPSGDVRDAMNPIVRNLYDKAMNSFDSIPPDRQMQAMQLIGDIETAAKVGDQAKVMSCYTPLKQLLDGIL